MEPRHALKLVAALVALAVPTAAAGAAPAPPPTPPVLAERGFVQLVAQTRHMPKNVARKRVRRALLRTAQAARKDSKGSPCRARKRLKSYLRKLRHVRVRPLRDRRPTGSSARGRLTARALWADAALLALPGARRCGGAKVSVTPTAKTTVLDSSERQLKLRIDLPPAHFVPHQVGGKDWMELEMEGMGNASRIGEPAVPSFSTLFGIPQGADVSIKVDASESFTLTGIDLYPSQPQPVDRAPDPTAKPPPEVFDEPPFQIDKAAYRSDSSFPSAPADTAALGSMRDLLVGRAGVSAGQYKPRSRTLKVFTSMTVTVSFGGASKGTFGSAAVIGNPWNVAFKDDYQALVNLQTILDHLDTSRIPLFCGEELLIVTSAALRPAANTLRASRSAMGYFSRVVEVGSGPGQVGATNTEIQAFIQRELTNPDCSLHPSYVILLGDSAQVPTFLVDNVASDLPYSLDGIGNDLFADVQLGRLPAPDLATADALVAKIDGYATTSPAPVGDDMLHHATVTSYFQPARPCVLNAGESGTPNCNANAGPVNGHTELDLTNHQDTRTFTKISEQVRNAMLGEGFAVDRVYTTDTPEVDPQFFDDGTPLPQALRRPGFAWDGDTDDVRGDWNDGRFLILHRDHGFHGGWSAPNFVLTDVPSLTNGTQLPVVFSINCASAMFDIPGDPSFVERIVNKPDGGAVAAFGDSRNSPSTTNSILTRGFFDAMFPNTIPDLGGLATRRLGDVLVRGKLYMESQVGAVSARSEHFLYGLFGDPTMQMWAAAPRRLKLDIIGADFRTIGNPRPGEPSFEVVIRFPVGGGDPPPEGTIATLLHDGEPIGRAVVGADGTATVRPDVQTDSKGLTVSYNQDGALPETDTVEGTP
jgi:Peptidase family C25/Propeptide_C25